MTIPEIIAEIRAAIRNRVHRGQGIFVHEQVLAVLDSHAAQANEIAELKAIQWISFQFCDYHKTHDEWTQCGCPVCAAGNENKEAVEAKNTLAETIAERDRLKAEVEELKTKFFSHPAVVEVHREREELRSEVARLQKERDEANDLRDQWERAAFEAAKDKARLDWLEGEMEREKPGSSFDSLFRKNLPITRAAIDAARQPS